MKAIGYILLSYFKQSPIIHFVLAIIAFIFASIWTLWLPFFTMNSEVGIKFNQTSNIHDPWLLFIAALFYLVSSMGAHLTRLIKSNASALVPYYRQKQLIASGILLTIFIVWPTVVTGYKGFPVLISLAMFLFTANLVLWSSFNFVQNIISFTIILWLLWFVYELLGLPTNFKILGSVSDSAIFSSNYIFPVSLIIISCISLYYFVDHFLNLSIQKFSKEESDNSAPESTINHDRVDPIAAKFVTRNLSRLLTHKKENKSSLNHTVRLIQFSCFTPSYVVSYLSSVLYLGMLFFMASYKYLLFSEIPVNDHYVLLTLFMAYPLISVLLTTDFLQHRNRMPAIWLQAQLTSRKGFTRATILTYLLVMGKQYITISLINLVIFLIFPFLSLTNLILIMAMGFIIFVAMLSLSLIVSKRVVSPDCRGWLIPTAGFWILTFMVLMGLAGSEVSLTIFDFLHFKTWLFIGSLAVFSTVLFRIAVLKWANTEMDFAGPEVSTSW